MIKLVQIFLIIALLAGCQTLPEECKNPANWEGLKWDKHLICQ